MYTRPHSWLPRGRHVAAACTALLLPLGAGAQQCTGDCDSDGNVAVNEIVTCVPIALNEAPLAQCEPCDTDGSAAVEIYELVTAVGHALTGCPAAPAGKASKSGPIAISASGDLVAAVNTDTNSVTLFAVDANGRLTKRKELGVGIEPRSVALLPNGTRAYVANTVSGTVSVIDLASCTTIATIGVGTEPWAVAATPNGRYVYVANASSNTVSAIDTGSNAVIATVPVGRSPRALAISNDGDDDDRDEKVFVPNFYARPRAGFAAPSTTALGGADGAGAAFPMGANGQAVVGEGMFDDSREGVIDVIASGANAVVDQILLAPMADTGFRIARGAFVNTAASDGPRTIFADGATDGSQAQATGAFPNQFYSIALFRGMGLLPNTAPSPEPPLRFNVNAQSLMSVIDADENAELPERTFNLNRGINFDLPPALPEAAIRDNTERMFPSTPVDIDCNAASDTCWVVSQGSDFIVRMNFDDAGKPTINAPTAPGPFPVSPVTRVYTIDPQDPLRSGRNPRGIAIDAGGEYAYVVCPTTRDVIVVGLADGALGVVQRVRSSELPLAGSAEETFRRGKIDFFTSRPFWSDRGWGNCAACHPDGGSDEVTWLFEAGPRQTVHLAGTFNKRNPEDQRALNWTPVRDENQDFELNTRSIFGGRGFITVAHDVDGDGLTPDSDPNVRNFGPASSDRAQQQEDITAWIQLGVRSPIAPPSGGNATRGREIFGLQPPQGAFCVACHSGGKWTTSRITYDPSDINPVPGTDTGIANIPPSDLDADGMVDSFEARAVAVYLNGFNSAAGAGRICEVPPPPPGVDSGEAMSSERIRILRQVQTFAPTNPVEVRGNGLSPVNTTAPALAVAAAFGADGFNSPSLLGVFETAPYFHHGAAQTLEQVFGMGTDPAFLPAARAHWRSGTGGAENILDSDPSAIADLIAFLKTIDDTTPPFPAADLAPNDDAFADAVTPCDCQRDPPVGNPVIDCVPPAPPPPG
ncbi:MAG: beta-propeller fold lactonase family protein [Candidatus Binatia bacterium]